MNVKNKKGLKEYLIYSIVSVIGISFLLNGDFKINNGISTIIGLLIILWNPIVFKKIKEENGKR